jgi:tetratricopeptide (TPR) repeat protein
LIVWAITFAILCAVSLNGLSRSIEEEAPETALSLNPLNAQARVNVLVTALNDDDDAHPARQLVNTAVAGLAASPIDARFHSLLAELRLRLGEEEEADRLFRQAHRLASTEIHALQHLFVRAVETGNYAEAVAHMDVMMRRWPARASELVSPLLPRLLSHEAAYAAVVEAMRSGAPWQGRVIANLARQEDGLGIAYQLLLGLEDSEHPPGPKETASVIRGYVAAKRFEDAYRLFRFTLPEEERTLTGFVHNGGFVPVSSAAPFSWQYRNTPAVEVLLSAEPPLAGATVRFLSVPAKEVVLNQTLLLPPGRYRLVTDVDASSLSAPRSLYWRIDCVEPQRRELLRLAIPEGSYQERRLEAEFEVDACALQRIGLATDVIADSWQNRYSGQARFRSLTIERLGHAEPQG